MISANLQSESSMSDDNSPGELLPLLADTIIGVSLELNNSPIAGYDFNCIPASGKRHLEVMTPVTPQYTVDFRAEAGSIVASEQERQGPAAKMKVHGLTYKLSGMGIDTAQSKP